MLFLPTSIIGTHLTSIIHYLMSGVNSSTGSVFMMSSGPGRAMGAGQDAEPAPVLPELVEANTVLALLRLGRGAEARLSLRRALRIYPNEGSSALPGIDAMLLAESEPLKAQERIENVAKRKAVNLLIAPRIPPPAPGRG
jgi:hypothetical protein